MRKRIYFVIVLAFIPITWFAHQHYDNLILEEEDLVLSITFMENVTKIENAQINLDFIENQLVFSSKFYHNGTGIMLDSASRGFVEHDNFCSNNIFLQFYDNGGQSLTFHDKQALPFYEYPNIEYIQLTKICKFQYNLVPNGKFTVHLFNQSHIQGAIVDNITFVTTFDDKEFGCSDVCVFTRQLYFDDSNNRDNIRTVILKGEDVDARTIDFSLRSFTILYENLSSIFYAIFIGLIMTSLGIGYDLIKKNDQDKNKLNSDKKSKGWVQSFNEKYKNWIQSRSDKEFLLLVLGLSALLIGIATAAIDRIFEENNLPRPDNLHTIVIEVGIGVIIAIMVYTFSVKQHKQVSGILEKDEKKKNRRLKYVFGTLEKYLPDVIVLANERNRLVEEYHKLKGKETKIVAEETKIGAEAAVRWLDSNKKHLEFLLVTNVDILEPIQIERFKIVIDSMHEIIKVQSQSMVSFINIKSLERNFDKLKEVTTDVTDWRDLPT